MTMTDQERCTDLAQWLFERVAQYKRDWWLSPHSEVTIAMPKHMILLLSRYGDVSSMPSYDFDLRFRGNEVYVYDGLRADEIMLYYGAITELHYYTSGDLGVQLDSIEQDMQDQ